MGNDAEIVKEPVLGTLRAGPAWFRVDEEPAYLPAGKGEHLYVEIEKEGLTTDQVAAVLAKAAGVRGHDVGFAGRKDRHGVTRQWFSVLGGKAEILEGLASPRRDGRLTVIRHDRHLNKIRLGHLAGNRFRLGISFVSESAQQAAAIGFARLVHDGIRNAFGTQRFGVNGASLEIARAWGRGDHEAAVAWVVDPAGIWKWGDALPDGFRDGPEGLVFGALRKGAAPAKALKASEPLLKLIASAAQSAVFNAVLAGRERSGLLHRLRAGDMGLTPRGAPFLVKPDEVAEAERRSAAGVLEAFTSGPLPGTNARLIPAPEVDAEEHAWALDTGMEWAWFAAGGAFESPGERRPLLVTFRSAPVMSAGEDGVTWVEFGLPSGTYATGVLEQVGIAVPSDRSAPGRRGGAA